MKLTRRHVNVLIESAHHFLNSVSNNPFPGEKERYANDIALLDRALDRIHEISLDSPSMLARCWILCRTASLPYTLPEYEEGLDWEWVETRNNAIIATIYMLGFPNDVHVKLHGGVLEVDWTEELKEYNAKLSETIDLINKTIAETFS
jgi:hypothetical protein